MSKIAVSYRRISGAGQVNGHGLDRQDEIITEWASANGYQLIGGYQEAHTGTEADRPEFMHMVADLLGNGCRTIIVESLDRLSRDLLVQSMLLAKLESEGITLISASTGEDVTASMRADPMRRALVQIQGVFAELDKSLLVQKLRKARDAKRVLGKCEGPKHYGHYEGEPEILARIHQLRRKPRGGKRLSWAKVAARLNEAGYRNRAGREWTPGNLWGVTR